MSTDVTIGVDGTKLLILLAGGLLLLAVVGVVLYFALRRGKDDRGD
jgi:hypothetical protein